MGKKQTFKEIEESLSSEEEVERKEKPRGNSKKEQKEALELALEPEQVITASDRRPFSELRLSDKTKQGLATFGFADMTPIQTAAIPLGLQGKDVLGAACTGSGKTLAFLIPAIEMLHAGQFKPRNGTGVLIVSPTRELALQIYQVAAELMKFHSQSRGLIMGGAQRSTEAEKLRKGVNLVVATPGRLLDHLRNTPGFKIDRLQTLVVDEADRILEIGFEEDMRAILRILPLERQTLLFSATQTQKVTQLSRMALRRPVFVNVEENKSSSTVEQLEQGYVVCEAAKRFLLLFTFLKKNRSKKVIVFMSSCNAVQFFAELLNYVDLPCLFLHGRQKQARRTNTFFEFVNASEGALICTDVAARGLDVPAVDWIVQFDPPDDPREYIHRVGRTARAGKSGRALLFLLPSETNFLKYLQQSKVPLNQYEFPPKKIANVQSQLERLVSRNYYLHKAAREAYRSYIAAYATHSLQDCFNVHDLDLKQVALAFGFDTPPQVDLTIGAPKRQKRRGGYTGLPDTNEAAAENAQKRQRFQKSLEAQRKAPEKSREEREWKKKNKSSRQFSR